MCDYVKMCENEDVNLNAVQVEGFADVSLVGLQVGSGGGVSGQNIRMYEVGTQWCV